MQVGGRDDCRQNLAKTEALRLQVAVAVCGRRDAVMPRNVQKDPEASMR